MKLDYRTQAPRTITRYEDTARDPLDQLSERDLAQVVEVFNTPLSGHYNWDYRVQDDRIKKLYQLGKRLNWDSELDINWERPTTVDWMPEVNNLVGYAPYEALSEARKEEFWRHAQAWTLSQFLHGEQGALLVASQLASCAPTLNAKLYAASQTFDEARHVETFNRFIRERSKMMYPVNRHLKGILDRILSDGRWDLKFIGMQIVIEGLALSAFSTMREHTTDPVLKDLLYLVIRDEARHVTFGINYLEEFVSTLSQQEREDRAQFAYEACVVSRDRLIATDVYEYFGWDVEETRERVLAGGVYTHFRTALFSRVIPNLKRIGLLTDAIRPKFEALGLLEYEDWPDDGDIDWLQMSRPLDAKEDVA
jgi:hypothetical protein